MENYAYKSELVMGRKKSLPAVYCYEGLVMNVDDDDDLELVKELEKQYKGFFVKKCHVLEKIRVAVNKYGGGHASVAEFLYNQSGMWVDQSSKCELTQDNLMKLADTLEVPVADLVSRKKIPEDAARRLVERASTFAGSFFMCTVDNRSRLVCAPTVEKASILLEVPVHQIRKLSVPQLQKTLLEVGPIVLPPTN